MELNVHNIKGKKTGKKVKLDSSVFGVEPNNHAIYLDVKSYLANKRQGTHKSRQRADIKGSTRKIKKHNQILTFSIDTFRFKTSPGTTGFLNLQLSIPTKK